MQTLSTPTSRPSTPKLRAAAETTAVAAATPTPCPNLANCAPSDLRTPSAHRLPCPMTCVGVKFQDLRWD